MKRSWLFSLFQLIAKAREYLGLSDLEKHTQGGGVLEVHIGDVFSSSVTIPGGYAGISLPYFRHVTLSRPISCFMIEGKFLSSRK